jgi:BirA family biotin operon repressor/biotin-[acetyl-CoA-carboxylase] ligase
VCEAIESLAPIECQVKWPNDVWVDGRKVAGVLIEAQPPDWAVVGIGLNVAIDPEEFPADLRHPAISVGNGVGVEEALTSVCEHLDGWVEAKAERVLAEFRERDALRGHRVRWSDAGEGSEDEGVASGIDERGNLIVATAEGERLSLGSGEVSLAVEGALDRDNRG